MARTTAKYLGKGCTEYVSCDYTLHIGFPEDMVICDLCPFCHTENSGTRFRCLETGEILPYHNKGTGLRCPLPIETKRDESEENEE